MHANEADMVKRHEGNQIFPTRKCRYDMKGLKPWRMRKASERTLPQKAAPTKQVSRLYIAHTKATSPSKDVLLLSISIVFFTCHSFGVCCTQS